MSIEKKVEKNRQKPITKSQESGYRKQDLQVLDPESWLLPLTIWYADNQRSLPWRETSDPYSIWISEIILQQTRVNQGLEYYFRFIERFPDVRTLAEASEQEVLALWQGLGYYSRARNLHTAARQVVEMHNGFFPSSYEAVRALKGIGDYTAAAVCSIAYNLPHAVVDGNVYRVLARLFATDTPIDSNRGKKEFQQLAQALLSREHPGQHNQAMMELGALVCVPVNPDCPSCPLQHQCQANALQSAANFPVKSKKTVVKELFYNYLYIHTGEQLLLRPRSSANNIWKNMYEFPLIEANHLLNPEEVLAHPMIKEMAPFILHPQPTDFTHILTHRKIYVRFYEIKVNELKKPSSSDEITTMEEIHTYPLPRVITRYLGGCLAD